MLTRPLRATGRLYIGVRLIWRRSRWNRRPKSLVVDGDRLTLTEAGETPRIIDLERRTGDPCPG